jgi:putative hemolysin
MTLFTALTILLIVTLLISVNSLYVAGEFSTVSARKTRIIQMAEQGNLLARTLLPVLQDPHKLDNYIAASQVGITLSSLLLGVYGEQQIAPRIAPWFARIPWPGAVEPASGEHLAAAGIAATLVLILLTTLQVVFGELLPKTVGLRYPEQLALATALPMKWSADYLLKPLIVVLNGSGALILKVLGITGDRSHAHVHSPEEIVLLVKESHRGGRIDAEEGRFLANVFRASETRAIEIAMPRPRLVAASVDRPLAEVLQLAADSAYSRIPIYRGDIDHIVGFVHLRDLFALYQKDENASLQSILRPVPFVPETLTSIEVWNRLDEAQSYLAIVMDEYGGTSGLITREDLIEELFGELQDEFDQEYAPFVAAGPDQYIVRGDMLISNLNDWLEIALPHEEAHTIGGLVMEELGRIPRAGDRIHIQGVELMVESVVRRSAARVRVTLPPATSPPLREAKG